MRWPGLIVRQLRAEGALAATTALVIVVATAGVVAGDLQPDAIARGSLGRTLADARPADLAVTVETAVAVGDADATDRRVRDRLAAALLTGNGRLERAGRSEAYALPPPRAALPLTPGSTGSSGSPTASPAASPSPAGAPAPGRSAAPGAPAPVRISLFAFAEGLADHATLIAGALPVAGAEPLQAMLSEPAAKELGLALGDRIRLRSQLDPTHTLGIAVVGLVRIDPADPFWDGDGLEAAGRRDSGTFTTIGPFFVERADLLASTVIYRAELRWRARPAIANLAPGDVAAIVAGLDGLKASVAAGLGTGTVYVTTGLTGILRGVAAGLAGSRGGVLLLGALVLALAAYALVLVALVTAERRRAITTLVRARGASGSSLLGLSVAESFLLAIPAVLLGPLLGVLALVLLGRLDDRSGATPIEPRLEVGSFVVAAALGLATVVVLTLPAIASVGPIAAVRRTVGRRVGHVGRDSGADVAVFLLAVAGVWQLRIRGIGPIGGSGTTPLDIVLLATPVVALVAGALLAVRAIPLLAAAAARPAARRRDAVAALAAAEVARRSTRFARPMFLLVAATAIAVFAASQGTTWEAAQRAQVAFAVPADLRVGPVDPAKAPAAASAVAAAPFVAAVAPVHHATIAASSGLDGVLLALSPERLRAVAAGAGAAGSAAAADLRGLDALIADRPALDLPVIPAGSREITLSATASLHPASAGGPAVPPAWNGIRAAVIVADDAGQLHRRAGPPARLADPAPELVVPIGKAADGSPGDGTPAGPLRLVAIEIELTAPGSVAIAGTLEVGRALVDGTPLDVTGWTFARSTFGHAPLPLAPPTPGSATIPTGDPIAGPGATIVALRPAALGSLVERPVAAIATTALLAQLGVGPGDRAAVADPGGTTQPVQVRASVAALPTVDPARPALAVDLATLSLVRYAARGDLLVPDEWWLATAPGGAPATADGAPSGTSTGQSATAAALRVAGLPVRDRAAEVAGRLVDPVAAGTLGALLLAGLVALFLAATGLAVTTWIAARERQVEIAVTRALGLSIGQLGGWLLAEQAVVLVGGTGAGILLGMALAAGVLPALALTPDGSIPVPPIEVAYPPGVLVLLVAGACAATVLSALLLVRYLRRPGIAAPIREAAT